MTKCNQRKARGAVTAIYSSQFKVRTQRMAVVIAAALSVSLIQPRVAWGHADLLAMIEAVAKQIESDPKNATLYLRRGELYRAHIDWKSAESDYDRAAQLDPKLAAVEFLRGRMLFESGRSERAKVELDKFLAGQTNHVDALMVRARVLVRLGQRKAAVADFSGAIAQSPEPGLNIFWSARRPKWTRATWKQPCGGWMKV